MAGQIVAGPERRGPTDGPQGPPYPIVVPDMGLGCGRGPRPRCERNFAHDQWQAAPDRRRRRRIARNAERAAPAARGIRLFRGRKRGQGPRNGEGGLLRHHPPRRRPSGHGRARGMSPDAPERRAFADHHADGRRHRLRRDPGPRLGRQRLRHETLPARRAAGTAACPHPPARTQRRRVVHDRPLYIPAERQAALRQRKQQEDPPHRQGGGDPSSICSAPATAWSGATCS